MNEDEQHAHMRVDRVPDDRMIAAFRFPEFLLLGPVNRLAQAGVGRVRLRALRGEDGDKRLRARDFRVRFTAEDPDTPRIHAVKNRKNAYR